MVYLSCQNLRKEDIVKNFPSQLNSVYNHTAILIRIKGVRKTIFVIDSVKRLKYVMNPSGSIFQFMNLQIFERTNDLLLIACLYVQLCIQDIIKLNITLTLRHSENNQIQSVRNQRFKSDTNLIHLVPPKAATILQHSQALGFPYLPKLCSHFLQIFCALLLNMKFSFHLEATNFLDKLYLRRWLELRAAICTFNNSGG